MLDQIKNAKLKKAETKEVNLMNLMGNVDTDYAEEPEGIEQRVLVIHHGDRYWISKKAKVVLITTKSREENMEKAYKLKFAQVVGLDNFDSTGMVEYEAVQLHKTHNFTHVVALREGDLLRGARIREKLGIKHGQSVNSVERFRDKVKMKERLREKGIKVPNFSRVESTMDIINFVEEHGFPVVIKPARGYSSVSTTVLKSHNDLLLFLQNEFLVGKGENGEEPLIDPVLGLEIEQFIEGRMFHIDGFYHNNEVKINWPSLYLNVVVNFKNNDIVSGCSLKKDDERTLRLQKYTEDVILNLLVDQNERSISFPFHSEAWITPNNDIVLCEIASRAGGGEIAEQNKQLFGCTLEMASLQWQCQNVISNKELDEKYTTRSPKVDYRVAWIYIYPKVGNKLISIPMKCEEPWNLVYKPLDLPGTSFTSRKSCADAISSFVLKVLDDEDEEIVIKKAYDWFEKNVVYEKI